MAPNTSTSENIDAALFRVRKKRTENSPDFFGRITLPGGKRYEISGWINHMKGDYEETYIALRFRPPFDQRINTNALPD